ncbi:hypothetical protein MTR_5g057633 [Medicago truncatula]|uniref:Uncharacterized protein n=1 Tax=Medicago truncatula TaxID=3880 RepID=A0A072UEZ4_MEDTR|nr:hypothetical protein MTR_5g057633 [Medicago truncatula]
MAWIFGMMNEQLSNPALSIPRLVHGGSVRHRRDYIKKYRLAYYDELAGLADLCVIMTSPPSIDETSLAASRLVIHKGHTTEDIGEGRQERVVLMTSNLRGPTALDSTGHVRQHNILGVQADLGMDS